MTYRVDDLLLTEEEVRRHRGACNAALNAHLTAGRRATEVGFDTEEDALAGACLDLADAVVRAYRLRCEDGPVVIGSRGEWPGGRDREDAA